MFDIVSYQCWTHGDIWPHGLAEKFVCYLPYLFYVHTSIYTDHIIPASKYACGATVF